MARIFISICLVALHSVAFAQGATDAAPAAKVTQAVSDTVVLPAMTPVEIEILEALNSKTSKIGQFFDIRLTAPIMSGGRIVVPAGIKGKGEIIHAAKARAAGKAGELIINARYLDFQGMRIPLRTLKYGQAETGKSKVDEAAAIGFAVATPLMLVITGGQVDIPAGMRATAKLAEEVRIEPPKENSQQEGKP